MIDYDFPITGHEKEFYEKAAEIGSMVYPYMLKAEILRHFAEGYEKCRAEDMGIVVDGKMVGFCSLICFEKTNFLYLLAIHPDCQRQGLATNLLGYINEKFPNPIMTMVDVESDETRWQKKFLEKHGFVMTPIKLDLKGLGEKKVFVRGEVAMWNWLETLERMEIMWADNYYKN